MFEIDRTVSMNYGETTKMVVESAKHFSEQYIRPNMMDWDESQFFPATVLRKAGEIGFMGLLIPEIYGGSGMGYHEYIAVIEEISKVDPSIGLSLAAHNSLAAQHVYLSPERLRQADPPQRAKPREPHATSDLPEVADP